MIDIAPMQIIAVLMTCHNRREKTLACLDALFVNALPCGFALKVFLVDDGSTDGTSAAVLEKYSNVCVIHGDGNLYWNRGMRLAFATAMEEGFNYYMWLNDDTFLYPSAIDQLLQTKLPDSIGNVIAVGAVCDPLTRAMTYGGARFESAPFYRPFSATEVQPIKQPQIIHVIHGNVVLIPDSIARKIGNLDPLFEHAMGDTDYSLRAHKIGVCMLLTAEYVGTCSRNSVSGTHQDPTLPLILRIRYIFSRKGLPWRPWLALCWRYAGIVWPLYFLWGYIKVILKRA